MGDFLSVPKKNKESEDKENTDVCLLNYKSLISKNIYNIKFYLNDSLLKNFQKIDSFENYNYFNIFIRVIK